MRSSIIVIVALALLHGVSQGQEELSQQSVFSDYLNVQQPGGFLRIPGLEFTSSMGFSYFTSEGFGSIGMGYYLGHFDLRLSSSLTLHWDMGLSSNLMGPHGDETPEFFLPNVDLTYKPSDRFFLRLQYHQYNHPSSLLWRRY